MVHNQRTRVAALIILVAIAIAIMIALAWWVVNEEPKSILGGIPPNLPCPSTNPDNTKDPDNPCTPARLDFNPPS